MSSDALATPVLRWLAAAVLVAAVPHATHLPVWVSALIPAALMLRLGLGRPPARWLLVLLVLLCFAAILARFHTIAGVTAGGAFLSAMIALKFLEARTARDAGLLICLAYFLAASVFLTSESIGVTAWVLGSVGLTTVALMTLALPDGPPLRQRVFHTARLFAQAAPIMLLLFVLFPRLPEPLWGMQNEGRARTGLSDTMEPGSITEVTQSSEVAFRVQFAADEPPAPPYYWRGPVFWEFDGRTWSAGERRARELSEPEVTGPTIEYTLMLAPHDQRWLFGLDLPLSADADYERAPGAHLLAPEKVESVRALEMRSALQYRMEAGELPIARRQRALELPSNTAPLTRELASRWRAEADAPRDIIERALAHFRERPFEYTLSPPATGAAPVDDFLFRTQSGYCEHYASAFTVLMRAAGLPARVVTGYLGGETNDMGDYMLVRQSDAHAWTEVWLPERGWTRVDPTQAVSSERVETGVGSVGGSEQLPLLSRSDGWLKQAALTWDAMQHTWNRVVVGYGPEMQERLLQRLGLGELGRYAMAVLAIVSAGVALAGVWLLSARRPPPADPAQRAWLRALARLRRAGIEPAPSEGPRDLAERVGRQRPDLGPAFDRVAGRYIALRYWPAPPSHGLERLREAVRAFRPRRVRRS